MEPRLHLILFFSLLFFYPPAYLLPCHPTQLLPAHILPLLSPSVLVNPQRSSLKTADRLSTDAREYELSAFLCLFVSSWFLCNSVNTDLPAGPALTSCPRPDSRILSDGALTWCSPSGFREPGRGRGMCAERCNRIKNRSYHKVSRIQCSEGQNAIEKSMKNT